MTPWLLPLLCLLFGLAALLWLLVRPGFRYFGESSVCLPAHREPEQRRVVWSALSELYLDAELSSSDHARIAAILAASPYSLDQLERILYCELHGRLVHNLLSPAGEWAAFDLEQLAQDLLRSSQRLPAARPTWRLLLAPAVVDREWRAIRLLTADIRLKKAASG